MKKWLIISTGIIVLVFAGYKIYDRFFYTGELVIAKAISPGVYHRVGCPLVKKSTANAIIVMSKEQVARHEYRTCKTCNPPYDTNYVLEIRKIKEQEKKAEEARQAEEHIKQMLKIKEEYINGENRSVNNAITLYKEGYLSKDDLIKYRPIISSTTTSILGKTSEREYKEITGLDPIYRPKYTVDDIKALRKNNGFTLLPEDVKNSV